MKMRLLTIGNKAPAWIQTGFEEYRKRLPHHMLELVEIPTGKRANDTMLSLIKPHHHVIALEIKGKAWHTEQLAAQLAQWQQSGQPIDFLIGGAEGLSSSCLNRAQEKWSLSTLTFPHMLVRVILAEQLYRAWSILNQHPYHRG